jgi:branched-chain amino acid transport system ATP-binding protein
MTATLSVEGLSGGYGSLAVFRDVGFAVGGDDIMGILGPNGAGKTTLLKTLAGLLPAQSGRVVFAGADVGNLQAHSRAQQGLVLVPEGRQILAGLSVRENLELSRAGRRLNTAAFNTRRDEVLTIFPRLSERLDQPGGSLSGGEQQMLAIARALLLDPRVLLLDEPTQGLAPIMVRQVLAALQALRGRFSMVVVEQNRAFLNSLAIGTLTMRGGNLGPMHEGATQ